jgi:3-phenylpropionate/cinnamic acid dioxygenase small subunit
MENLQLQELLDREAIKELRYKFAEGLDNKDWDLFQSLFLDEIHTDFSDWGISPMVMKREDFVNFFKQAFSKVGLKTQHIYSNFRIAIEGNSATCKSNFLGQHFIKDCQGGEEFFLKAEYTDKLTKTNDGWKFSNIKLSIFYTSGNASILAG